MLTCCFLLDDIRTRSKLIEVGGATALAMMAATAAAGLLSLDPLAVHRPATASTPARPGWRVGFVVLGILPFIEKAFRITTSMTLLELADAQPAAAAPPGDRSAGHVQPQPPGRDARRGGGRGDRRQLAALPRRQPTTTTSARSTSPTTSSRTRPAAQTATSTCRPASRC